MKIETDVCSIFGAFLVLQYSNLVKKFPTAFPGKQFYLETRCFVSGLSVLYLLTTTNVFSVAFKRIEKTTVLFAVVGVGS